MVIKVGVPWSEAPFPKSYGHKNRGQKGMFRSAVPHLYIPIKGIYGVSQGMKAGFHSKECDARALLIKHSYFTSC